MNLGRLACNLCLYAVEFHTNRLKHDNVSWFSKVKMEELEWFARSTNRKHTEKLWDGLKYRLPHITSLPDFTYAHVANWINLMEKLPKEIITARRV